MVILRLLLFLGLPGVVLAQKFYTYVGDADTRSVLIAWGTTSGSGNTIGRWSSSHGRAEVRVGARSAVTEKNWIVIDRLEPDTEYDYRVAIGGKTVGEGKVLTWPEKAGRLVFFVMGDYGNGSRAQYQVAEAMTAEFERRLRGEPVRFVLTTGDNIYASGLFRLRNSGSRDRDWGPKFFEPYQRLAARIPFYPTLGNHDGNETESRGDLAAYLDNFFFRGSPARYYRFTYGGLADFFALDTTLSAREGPKLPLYGPDSHQYRWLVENISSSRTPWKIPYFHHPVFGAGPRHEPSLGALTHLAELFKQNGVRVVFSGHEHNFQFSEQNGKTFGIRFVVTGAGGELRPGDIRNDMQRSHVEGWSPQHHFLVVEIEGREMRITPLSYQRVVVLNREGKPIEMPLKVKADAVE